MLIQDRFPFKNGCLEIKSKKRVFSILKTKQKGKWLEFITICLKNLVDFVFQHGCKLKFKLNLTKNNQALSFSNSKQRKNNQVAALKSRLLFSLRICI